MKSAVIAIFRCFILLGLLVAAAATATAQDTEQIGVGIILGEPTGFNVNYRLERRRSADFQLGFSSSRLHLNASYLLHERRAMNLDGVVIDWYYGIGVHYYHHDRDRPNQDDETDLGVRVPIGLDHSFRRMPLVAFAELGPTMNVVESTSFGLDFGLGLRYHF